MYCVTTLASEPTSRSSTNRHCSSSGPSLSNSFVKPADSSSELLNIEWKLDPSDKKGNASFSHDNNVTDSLQSTPRQSAISSTESSPDDPENNCVLLVLFKYLFAK